MPYGECPAARCPSRFQLMYMRACAITLLICFLLYTVTLTDVHVKTTQSLKSWNISRFLKNAAYKLQSVMQFPAGYKLQAMPFLAAPRKRKVVLLWTKYFQKSDWLPSLVDLQCPVTDCDVTSNRSLVNSSSAVILHWRNIELSDLPKCIPSETDQCPLWVLFNKEAPPHTPRAILEAVQNRVHWTVTYRRDSTIQARYGKLEPKKIRSSKSVFENNRRLLCWLVSNCNTPSKREVFVSELKNFVEVDVYGQCGDMQCPYKLVRDCYRWISNRCMFYLSLENSICKDYTTEKLYHALASDMVPVVMGNSSNYDHLPPRSVINAADFSSPKELAEYLVSVSKDKKRYLSYFDWKRDYEVRDQSYLWICSLCQKLHDTDLKKVKPQKDLMPWWFDQSECTSWRNS